MLITPPGDSRWRDRPEKTICYPLSHPRPSFPFFSLPQSLSPSVPSSPIHLSVVVPAHNEQDNVARLLEELTAALDGRGLDYEVIVVDDASSDETPAVLLDLLGRYERLSVLRLSPMLSGGPNGQSAAFGAGVRAARGELIAMLDADLQNDPADLAAMLELLERTGADMVQGDRRRARRDSLGRRAASGVGRLFRRLLLGDTIKDTGCSLRVMRRAVAVAMPFEFRGMHRFVPITARQLGYTVVEKPVSHRPRVAGKAKYGVLDRALPGLHDCIGVRWMAARRRSPRCERIERPAPPPADPAAATERATT